MSAGRDARIKSKTECASDTEQRSNDAAVKDAQKGPSKEEFALRMMEQITTMQQRGMHKSCPMKRSVQDARGVSQPS